MSAEKDNAPSFREHSHPKRWVVSIILIVILLWLIHAFVDADISWRVVQQYLFSPSILWGLLATVAITLCSMLLGLILGVLFAVMRLSDNPVARSVASLYLWVFRGTPVYVQLLMWFNIALVFPTISFFGSEIKTVDVVTPFIAALLGLGVNEGAYLTEIIRGGIMSVDAGSVEAADALGIPRFRVFRRIVMPQAMHIIVPSLGNQFIGMLKTSSLASAVAYEEMLLRAQQIYFVNNFVMELLFVAATWYLITTSLISIVQYFVEKFYSKGTERVKSA